ncbi:hypothetical protein IV203_017317 [Nitzschia inconspicua]|uniref:Uncharacterized protein n=1 Tax=Nitzschia inconspicua TaxID=303405 RepID=A0A9K3PI93_9STRA|nr:hypothetical protein IV203_017317 [Nitzschia inconspicua]
MMKQVLFVAALVASASAFAPSSRLVIKTTTTSLNAEWEKEWKESDFEGDLAKLQKEAEERLDTKISELMSNIEKTGSTGN